MDSIDEFEYFQTQIQLQIQNILNDQNYNSIDNFLDFYENFRHSKATESSNDLTFMEYFRRYTLKIQSDRHTCVGLSLEMLKKLHLLEKIFPNLSESMFLVSCEENVNSNPKYKQYYKKGFENYRKLMDKEHTLVAINILLENRFGVLLIDLGYHVSRVVVAMADECYPHTGRFVQMDQKPKIVREYEYKFSSNLDNSFIEWYEYLFRNNCESVQKSVIYVKKPFLTAIDVTERRNLVYNCRSLISRNLTGEIVAAIYFDLTAVCDNKENDNGQFTARYVKNGVCHSERIAFTDLLPDKPPLDHIMKHLKNCSLFLNIEWETFLQKLQLLAFIFNDDREFIENVLHLNGKINDITK